MLLAFVQPWPALSVLLATVALPIAFYSALVAARSLVPVALGAVAAAVGVVGYWLYALLSAISNGA